MTFWILRLAGSAIALFAVLLQFQLLSTNSKAAPQPDVTERATSLERYQVEVHSPTTPDSDFYAVVGIKGVTQPSCRLTFWAATRELRSVWADSTGAFSVSFPLPIALRSVQVRNTEDLTIDNVNLSDAFRQAHLKNHLLFAVPLPGRDSLWVVGVGQPGQAFSYGDSRFVYGAIAYNGVLDRLVPASVMREGRISLKFLTLSMPARVFDSTSINVGPRSDEAIPWARRVVVTEADSGVLSLSAQITVPARHPLFQALAHGYIDAGDFLNNTVALTLASGFTAPRLRLDGTTAVVTLRGQLLRSGSEAGFSPRAFGIASQPLLTARDEVVWKFDTQPPAWFGNVLPLIDQDSAVWRGPILLKGGEELVVGQPRSGRGSAYPPPQVLKTTSTAPQEESDHLSMTDYLRGAVFRFDLLRRAMLLLPFLAVFWLARRHEWYDRIMWSRLAGAALILMVWTGWSTLLWLGRLVNEPLITAASPAIAAVYAPWSQPTSDASQVYVGAANTVSLLILCTLIAMVPLYYPTAVQLGSGWRPRYATDSRPPFASRAIRGGRRAVHLVYAVSAVILLVVGLLWLFKGPSGVLTAIHFDITLPSPEPAVRGILLTALAFPLLAAFGWRAALFGVTMIIVATWTFLHGADSLHVASSLVGWDWLVGGGGSRIAWLGAMSRYWIIVSAALLALPLVHAFVVRLTPSAERHRHLRQLAAVFLVVAGAFATEVPKALALTALGTITAFGTAWILFSETGPIGSLSEAGQWLRQRVLIAVGVTAVVIVALAWPYQGQGMGPLDLRTIQIFVGEVSRLFVYVLALALALILRNHEASTERDPEEWIREAAIVLFAVFLISSTTLWVIFPVRLLVAVVVARYWLLRSTASVARLRGAAAAAESPRALIRDVLAFKETRPTLDAARRELQKKLKKAEITPEDYESQLKRFTDFYGDKLTIEVLQDGVTSRQAVFSVRGGKPWSHALEAVHLGALLSVAPTLIALYSYLRHSDVTDPYPELELLVLLATALATWLLYAFFFGYFYDHIAGDSGLSKGMRLSAAIIAPFLAHQLLFAPTLEELRYFTTWAAEVFVFCTLLGLAMDWRTLRRHGFDLSSLRAVHSTPALSAYGSSLIAAIAPTIIALTSKQVQGFLGYIFTSLLPGGPGPTP